MLVLMSEASTLIPRARLHDQVVRQLALLVIGSPTDGSLPNEIELMRRFGVSRTVVREAVKVLASKGLIAVRPKTGMRVRPRHDWNLLDPDLVSWQYEAGPDESFFAELSEVRMIVETSAAELAAVRAADHEISAIFGWLRQMEQTVEDNEAFIAADLQFHHAILEACHNNLLRQMSGTVGIALRESRLITTQIPGSSRASLPLHAAVADAIRDHDAASARAAMEHLLRDAADGIKRVLHSQQTTIPAAAEEQ